MPSRNHVSDELVQVTLAIQHWKLGVANYQKGKWFSNEASMRLELEASLKSAEAPAKLKWQILLERLQRQHQRSGQLELLSDSREMLVERIMQLQERLESKDLEIEQVRESYKDAEEDMNAALDAAAEATEAMDRREEDLETLLNHMTDELETEKQNSAKQLEGFKRERSILTGRIFGVDNNPKMLSLVQRWRLSVVVQTCELCVSARNHAQKVP